ncbi:hypothetical protein ACRAWC_20855 [Leifsonia sp. L25]|uniref:hypothetical protein n=1 Tax=Leifsonia sp. L25 TaxID=3423957 RepID=UPI003D690812
MTNIDDSTQTPPGYWFGVIEGRLHERMRDALADLDLRRGSWRILHTLADGPATPEELAHRLPDGGRRPHRAGSGDPRERFGRVAHPGWRSQEPRDEQAYAETGGRPQTQPDERPTDADGSAEPERHAPGHERGHGRHPEHGGGPEYPQDHGLDHEHDHDHHDHHDHGHHHDHDHHGHHHFEQAFERGYVRGFDRGFAFGAARAGYGPAAPFRGGRGYGRGYGPTPGASFPGAARLTALSAPPRTRPAALAIPSPTTRTRAADTTAGTVADTASIASWRTSSSAAGCGSTGTGRP